MGKWNGAGGKKQEDETVIETAVREVHEEIGVKVREEDLEKCAEISYGKTDDPNWGMDVQIFITRTWKGELKESEEMKPDWFELEDIPFGEAWQDLVHWLPRILAGEKLKAAFIYKEDGDTIESMEVLEVREF